MCKDRTNLCEVKKAEKIRFPNPDAGQRGTRPKLAAGKRLWDKWFISVWHNNLGR
jgi:hypothetical protein